MAETQTVQLWDYWFILRKRKFMILATLFVVIAIVLLVNALQRPIYSAYTDLIIEASQPSTILSSSAQQGRTNYFDSVFFDTQAKLLHSSFFTGLVVDGLDKRRSEFLNDFKDITKERLASMVSQATIILPSMNSARVIRIAIEDTNPSMAALLSNTIAEEYMRYTQQTQIESSKQVLVYLMDKLEQLRDKLKNSAYTMSDLNVDEELTAASKIYGERHPIVLELKAKKKAIEESLKEKDRQTVAQTTPSNEATLSATTTDPERAKDEFSLGRRAAINEELYQVLLKKLQELNVTGATANFNVRVIEPAKVPGKPVRPNKRLNLLIGILMGSVMGIGMAFFREYLDTTIKTVDELKNNFKLTVLGLIPTIGESKPKTTLEIAKERLRKNRKESVAVEKNEIKDELSYQVHRLASAEELKAPVAEAYRTLRTNLQFTQLDRPLQTLLVTSSIRGEGKTTTSVNLSIIMAQTGKKVLLVDTDLRRPRIHKAFSTGREIGLTNLLMGEMILEDVLIPADVPNLHILPSGPLPPNPAELVATDRMKSLIKYMTSKYDLVIFDSPPLVAVTDAALLATEVDGLLLVVEAGALPRELLKQGLDRLSNVKATILGAVLNNVNLQKGSYYYYYYHYYHYDYASADKR